MFVLLAVVSAYGQMPEKAAERSLILDEGVAAHKGLDEIYARFSEGYKKLDPAAVANLYTETAAYLVPGTEIEIGREKILASFTKFFDSVKQRNGRLEISFQIVQRQAEQTLAYDVGIYTLTSFREGGETRVSKGKFFVVGKPDKDGVWRFQVDGFNDLPKPPK
ncbi:MAG TPA: SgcJ/EcaC family oxidoreductase [Chthoniobacterales bacterium]|nr:SgcJ/EcaC family oxidoreductase [Chthoniobacterales bacterium]